MKASGQFSVITGRFTPEEEAHGINWIPFPRAGNESVKYKKISDSQENRTPVMQPVA
jgi:hypothetical protein